MELRSGRRLGAGDDGVDHISGLPDDLLLKFLARFRCASAAATTSVISSRWRGLWTHLPELSFHDVALGALHAALAQVARTELSLLDINVPLAHWLSGAAVTSLLRAAARLAPSELTLAVWGDTKDPDIAVEMPSFHGTKSIKLQLRSLDLTPPAAGVEFPALERLSITSSRFNFADLILRCPRLSVLEVRRCRDLGTIVVHSTTIEELVVDCELLEVEGIDIDAPVLKKFSLNAYMGKDFSVSFVAPMVKDLRWHFLCRHWNVGIGEIWRLSVLNLWMIKEGVYGLGLTIKVSYRRIDADRNLMQQVSQLPGTFSVLELNLATKGHVLGAMVLNVLEICTAIQSLKVDMPREVTSAACLPNCPCDQPRDCLLDSS